MHDACMIMYSTMIMIMIMYSKMLSKYVYLLLLPCYQLSAFLQCAVLLYMNVDRRDVIMFDSKRKICSGFNGVTHDNIMTSNITHWCWWFLFPELLILFPVWSPCGARALGEVYVPNIQITNRFNLNLQAHRPTLASSSENKKCLSQEYWPFPGGGEAGFFSFAHFFRFGQRGALRGQTRLVGENRGWGSSVAALTPYRKKSCQRREKGSRFELTRKSDGAHGTLTSKWKRSINRETNSVPKITTHFRFYRRKQHKQNSDVVAYKSRGVTLVPRTSPCRNHT